MAVVAADPHGALRSTDEIVRVWKKRIDQAREARKPFEPVWLSNLAFASGNHWVGLDNASGRLRHIKDLEPRYANRNLYTADRITEYLRAQLGELSSGDDRLDMLAVQTGDEAEQVADQLNAAIEYAWNHEWNAQKALRRARGYSLTMGHAAIRCRFDPTRGPVAGHLPTTADGQPVTDRNELAAMQQTGALSDGSLPRFVPVKEGRTVWTPLTPFELLTPPGVAHEDDFPWEIIAQPVPLDALVEQFGPAAERLTEDGDIESTAGLSTVQRNGSPSRARLRDHAWLYTCFQRPNRRHPDGQIVYLASNSYRLLGIVDQLDYKLPNGTPHTGVVYLHWHRLDDRFQSRAFIENLKDGQRTINEIKTTQLEILWRGLPKVFTKQGDLIHNPRGLPLENIEMKQDAAEPSFFAGIGPGPWMDAMVAAVDADLSHASTLSPLKLGENPAGVDTYSQLQLLNQNENYKRSDIILDQTMQTATLQELGVWDIKQYWPEEKQIMVAGPDGSLRQQSFQKSQIPPFFQAKVQAGVALDRSEAAELKKIDAIWQVADATGVTQGPNGQKWTEWYAKSLDASKALDLPGEETDTQTVLAHYENELMKQGLQPVAAEHDVQAIHAPIHYEALDQARAAGDADTAQRLMAHIASTVQSVAASRRGWRLPDPLDPNDMADSLALDEDQALRENDMLLHGQPLNPEETQKALASLQHGVNPETGQPVTPQDDLHMLLLRASLKPTLIENLELHMDRHGKVIKSAEFAGYPPEVRQRFLIHFDLTRELYLSLPLLPDKMTPPKISLSLREGVGATTTAQILRRGGVPEADPQTIASEPSQAQVIEQLKQAVPAPAPAPKPKPKTGK